MESSATHTSSKLARVREAYVRGLGLSLSLFVWGIFGALVGCLPLMLYKYNPMMKGVMLVDVSKNETMYINQAICSIERETFLEQVWCFDFEFLESLVTWPFLAILPCGSFLLYIKLGWLKSLVLIVTQLCGVLCVRAAFLGQTEFQYNLRPYTLGIPFIFTIAALWSILPRDSKIPLESCKMLFIAASGFVTMMTFDALLALNSTLFFYVIFPLGREFALFLSRSMAKHLVMDPNVGGSRVQLRREYGWIFVLWIQVFIATWYRVMVNTFESWVAFALFMVYSTILEVILRLTVAKRDNLAERLFLHCCCCLRLSRKSSPVEPMMLVSIKKKETNIDVWDANRSAEKEWHALLSVGEMLAEYVAIAAATILSYVFQDAVLLLPLPVFVELANPLEGEDLDVKTFLTFMLLQLFLEIVIDSFCIALEDSKVEIPIHAVWNKMGTKVKFVNILMAGVIAITTSRGMVILGGGGSYTTQMCTSIELCSCKPPAENIFGQYCKSIQWDQHL